MENYKEHGHLVYRSSVRRLTLMIGVSVADEHQIEFRTSLVAPGRLLYYTSSLEFIPDIPRKLKKENAH